MKFCELLEAKFSAYRPLSRRQLNAMEAHYQLLAKWNEKLNLTRILRVEEAVELHYCESLFLGLQVPPDPLTIADVGSGGGFPGIPIAILRPDCQVTLIESHQRKSVFLREAARNLPNVVVLPQRAEEVKRGFDWIVSRAVAPRDVQRLLAPRTALLLGAADAQALGGAWSVIQLPWGEKRVVASRTLIVPRGTSTSEKPD